MSHGTPRPTRRRAIAAVLLAAAAVAASALALRSGQFEEKAFQAHQEAGSSIIIEAHAGWCPVCWKQAPIVTELLQRPDLKW